MFKITLGVLYALFGALQVPYSDAEPKWLWLYFVIAAAWIVLGALDIRASRIMREAQRLREGA